MVSHHPVKFGGHRHCGSGDLVVSQNEVMKESSYFMGKSP